MDRPIDAVAIAASLLSNATEFEGRRRTFQVALEGLALLGTLSEITDKSLEALPKKAEPAPQAARIEPAVAAPAPVPAPAPEVRYSTGKNEYQPALKDQNLVQALVALSQQRARERALRQGNPGDTSPGFHAPVAPQIEAKPKYSYTPRSPGIYQTILRAPKNSK